MSDASAAATTFPLTSSRLSYILNIWDKEYIGLAKCTEWPFYELDQYGIQGPALKWFVRYPKRRSQYVTYNGVKSKKNEQMWFSHLVYSKANFTYCNNDGVTIPWYHEQ